MILLILILLNGIFYDIFSIDNNDMILKKFSSISINHYGTTYCNYSLFNVYCAMAIFKGNCFETNAF